WVTDNLLLGYDHLAGDFRRLTRLVLLSAYDVLRSSDDHEVGPIVRARHALGGVLRTPREPYACCTSVISAPAWRAATASRYSPWYDSGSISAMRTMISSIADCAAFDVM